MDDKNYPGAEDESSEAPETDKQEKDESDTALVSKEFLGGDCKPGDKYTVEVVREYEDEAEIKLAKSKSDESDANSKLDAMSSDSEGGY
jgi:hypothetical protein